MLYDVSVFDDDSVPDIAAVSVCMRMGSADVAVTVNVCASDEPVVHVSVYVCVCMCVCVCVCRYVWRHVQNNEIHVLSTRLLIYRQ